MASVVSHEPLRENEIRLVDFGARAGEPVLVHASLISQTPKYTALSYCWGTDNCLHQFVLNGQVLIVTSALLRIFQDLQSRGFKGKIWADAICIGQTDIKEKAAQIALMGKTYSQAEEVIAWLRVPDNPPHDLTSTELDTLWAKVADVDREVNIEFQAVIEELDLPPLASGFWTALANLCMNSWFHRLWTLQEAVLAAKLTLYFGTLEWPLVKLSRLLTKLYEFNLEILLVSETGINSMEGAQSTLDVIDAHATGQLRNSHLVIHSKARLTSNACDKVYALYNLGDLRETVPLDLCASPQRVFIRFAKAVMKYDQYGLWLLYHVQGPNRMSGLPSWVPDLTDYGPPYVLAAGRFTACLDIRSAQTPHPCVSLDDNNDTLGLNGFVLDTISQVVDKTSLIMLNDDDEGDFTERAQKALDWLDACTKLAEETLRTSKTDANRVLYKTLVADTPAIRSDVAKRFDDRVTEAFEFIRKQYKAGAEGKRINMMKAWSIVVAARAVTFHRRVFSTSSGRIGIGPAASQAGDEVLILYGDLAPEVARRRPDGDSYQFLGQAYIDGVMEGQAIEIHEASGSPDKLFIFD